MVTDKFPAAMKTFQWVGKKIPEKKDELLTLFSKTMTKAGSRGKGKSFCI